MTTGKGLYAVVGRSESYPIVYHMNQTRERAERLRERREAATERPCFIVPMAEWRADPGDALMRAQAERLDRASRVWRRMVRDSLPPG